MICLRTLLRFYEKIQCKKVKKLKVFLAARAALRIKEFYFGGITPQSRIEIL
jgi:hypothetical protein